MITLKEINKIYKTKHKEITAVKDVSLSIEEGEIYGIIGYSGAGKSTLVRMFNGLEKPTTGEVLINGENINTLTRKKLRQERQKVSMIFQHFNLLWSRTVKENILFPLEIAGVSKEERNKRAEELIQLVGLKGREDSYPSEISGGQKQRVGIARALANEPKVLLCDEATSSLDPQTTKEVLNLLVDINRRLNLTIVVITHEMNVIRKICQKVAVMEEGQVVEEGNVVDVFKQPQREVTKQFIRQDSDSDQENIAEIIQNLKTQFPDSQFLSLKFQGQGAQTPIISKVTREFEVDINIMEGNIQSTTDTLLGTLEVQLIGDELNIERAIAEFQKLDVEVEVIEDVL